MLSSTFLLPLIPFITTTSARALFTGSAYILPSLTATTTTTTNTTTFQFTVRDPDPITNITTTCNSTWSGTSYPSTWIPCEASGFDWELSAFTDISSFELQVKHSFVDPSVGQPPQDVATTFAKATFTTQNLTCDASSCSLTATNGTVKLPIWAAVA